MGTPEGRQVQVSQGATPSQVPHHQQQSRRRSAQRSVRRPEEHGDPVEGSVEATDQEVPVEGTAGTLLRSPEDL